MPKEAPKYNKLCENCLRKCKQNENTALLSCPFHDPIPVQLEIKVPGLTKPRAKRS